MLDLNTEHPKRRPSRKVNRTPKDCTVKYFIIITFIVFIYVCIKTVMIHKFYQINLLQTQEQEQKLYYILQWTSETDVPFVYMGRGRQGFIDRNCSYTNCFVTANRSLLGNYTNFDVIAFSGPQLTYSYYLHQLPEYRSPHQKFAFISIESSQNYPVCTYGFDGFFNWTWTYKLNSDSRWGYIVVRNKKGDVVGPKINMKWINWEDMLPTPNKLQIVLKRKRKLAAWFVSNCYTASRREAYVYDLQKELRHKYSLQIDVFGKCSIAKCPRDDEKMCNELIRQDYKFYLVFENSFGEDYVTEKLMHAVEYNAIPIVYGGADYSRFLPPQSYLNAGNLSVSELAAKMFELSNNMSAYIDYFRWTRYYTYYTKSQSPETDDYCSLCALINNRTKVMETSIYKKFRKWWDAPDSCVLAKGQKITRRLRRFKPF